MTQSSGGESSENNKQNPFNFNFTEMLNSFSQRSPLMDKDVWMQHHRKNMAALTEANTMAAEIMKTIGQLQTQFIKQAFDDMSTIMQDFTKGAGQDHAERHSATLRNNVSRLVEHGNSMANVLSQSHQQIYDVFQTRMQEGAEEFQEMSGKGKSRKKH